MIDFLFIRKVLILFGLALYIISTAIATVVMFYRDWKITKQEKKNEKMIHKLLELMVNDKIQNKEDIRLYVKIHTPEDKRYETNFLKLLEQFSVIAMVEVDDVSKRDQIRAIIDEMIQEENKAKPFEGVGDKERPYFMAIQNLIPENDKEEITANLDQIVSVFKEQKISIKKNKKNNDRALMISISGILLSVFLSVTPSMPIPKESIDAIKSEVVEIEREQTDTIIRTIDKISNNGDSINIVTNTVKKK